MENTTCKCNGNQDVDIDILFVLKDLFFSTGDLIVLNPIASTILTIEMFPIFFMFLWLLDAVVRKTKKKVNKILERSAKDKAYQNNVASVIFFFADMGPNISSFSVIAIFITTGENIVILTVVFFLGIIVKEGSRKLKNKFYSEINKRCLL